MEEAGAKAGPQEEGGTSVEFLGLILCLADHPFKSGFLGLFSRWESDFAYSSLKRLVYKA